MNRINPKLLKSFLDSLSDAILTRDAEKVNKLFKVANEISPERDYHDINGGLHCVLLNAEELIKDSGLKSRKYYNDNFTAKELETKLSNCDIPQADQDMVWSLVLKKRQE